MQLFCALGLVHTISSRERSRGSPTNYLYARGIAELSLNPGTEVFTVSVANIEEPLIHKRKDIYSAEKQIKKALPETAKATTSLDLKAAFESHLNETGQIERLDQISETLGKTGRGKVCHGMQGVLEEGSEVLEDTKKGGIRFV